MTKGHATNDQDAARQGARFAVRLLNADGSIYVTDYHKDEVMAEVQGQMWQQCGGGGYRVDRLAAQA